MTKQQWIQLATVFGIPFVIALMKRFAPIVPKKWLPIICPIIGAAADVLGTGTFGYGTAFGAALGAAAVGVREIYDQFSGNAAKPKAVIPPADTTSTGT